MRYEEYKDSGIEWLGEVPSHWEIMPLKRTGTFGNGLTYSPNDICTDNGILVLRSSNIQNDKLCFDDNVYVNDCPKELIVKPGDIIICSRNGSASLVGKCAMVEKELRATFGAFMMRYRPLKNANKRFSFYMLQSSLKFYKGLYSTTTINQLTKSVIEQITVSFPPHEEQLAIASYLDKKCGKINGAIDVQKKKIDLLNELKQTIITNAVTKGLNPDAPMKDSGVEWIGHVPEHWEVKRLKFNSKFINGFAFKSDSFSDDGEYPVIRIGDIYNDGISYDNIVYVPLNSELDNYKVRNNDILIAMSGATVGKVGLCNSSDVGYINQRVGIVRSKIYKLIWYNLLSPKFLEYIYLMSDGSAQPNISSKGIRDYYIAIPSHEEQQEIIEYLTKKVSNIETQIAKANRRIELLNELKQSIITEAVTGKVKVC